VSTAGQTDEQVLTVVIVLPEDAVDVAYWVVRTGVGVDVAVVVLHETHAEVGFAATPIGE
jgi:hypothetical protein